MPIKKYVLSRLSVEDDQKGHKVQGRGKRYIAEKYNTGQATGSETRKPASKVPPDMTMDMDGTMKLPKPTASTASRISLE